MRVKSLVTGHMFPPFTWKRRSAANPLTGWYSSLTAISVRGSLEQTRLEKRLADERVGGTRQKLAALEALERQQEALQAVLLAERERISLLEVLREAFGKRGIPNMIIETVVPEVEEVANALLAKMTEGR